MPNRHWMRGIQLYFPAREKSSGPLGWGELEFSLSLSQQEPKVRQGTKPGVCNLWLVWRRKSCVLVHSSTDKICTEKFLKRIWRKTYATYTKSILSSRSAISVKWTSGQSWGMASACIPDRQRAGSIQPETFGHWYLCSTKVLCSWSKFLTDCSCQRPKSALFKLRTESRPPLACRLTANPVRYIWKPLL